MPRLRCHNSIFVRNLSDLISFCHLDIEGVCIKKIINIWMLFVIWRVKWDSKLIISLWIRSICFTVSWFDSRIHVFIWSINVKWRSWNSELRILRSRCPFSCLFSKIFLCKSVTKFSNFFWFWALSLTWFGTFSSFWFVCWISFYMINFHILI